MEGFPPLPENVIVWMADRANYVESIGPSLRMITAEMLGRNIYNNDIRSGRLITIPWDTFFKLRPKLIEISFSESPIFDFLNMLEDNLRDEQIREYFAEVRTFILGETSVSPTQVLKLLSRFTTLALFSFPDTFHAMTAPEWESIMVQLGELNLRGIDVSGSILYQASRHLNVSLLKLSGAPGANVKTIHEEVRFPTVKVLVVEELNPQLSELQDPSAGQLLDVLPETFPSLQTLIWDWNVVNPEVIIDDYTTEILQKLAVIYKNLKLEAFAITSASNDRMSTFRFAEMANILQDSLGDGEDVKLHEYETSGLFKVLQYNSLILVGSNEGLMSTIYDMYVKNETNDPPMQHYLRLVDGEAVPIYKDITFDFAGWDNKRISKLREYHTLKL